LLLLVQLPARAKLEGWLLLLLLLLQGHRLCAVRPSLGPCVTRHLLRKAWLLV
jgi:hypothetical protein